jgi:hypothetical protein
MERDHGNQSTYLLPEKIRSTLRRCINNILDVRIEMTQLTFLEEDLVIGILGYI